MTGLDLLILGAGPAGCGAAIRARGEGLSVLLLELDDATPKVAPGETLHPGIEPIFEQLGILEDVVAAGFHRHRGVWLVANGRKEFSAYGEDEDGPWLGFQARRRLLHQILRKAAGKAGATLRLETKPQEVLREQNRVVGVKTKQGEVRARWTIDATGRAAWLAKRLDLETKVHSPPLGVRFGWRNRAGGEMDEEPTFCLHESGWDWQAPLDEDSVAWAELRIGAPSGPPPTGTDLTWRHRPAAASPGYFLLGDAAATLDPASSHGVLRALMSGILCGYLAGHHRQGSLTESAVVSLYRGWIADQFAADVSRLRQLYEHSPAQDRFRLNADRKE